LLQNRQNLLAELTEHFELFYELFEQVLLDFVVEVFAHEGFDSFYFVEVDALVVFVDVGSHHFEQVVTDVVVLGQIVDDPVILFEVVFFEVDVRDVSSHRTDEQHLKHQHDQHLHDVAHLLLVALQIQGVLAQCGYHYFIKHLGLHFLPVVVEYVPVFRTVLVEVSQGGFRSRLLCLD